MEIKVFVVAVALLYSGWITVPGGIFAEQASGVKCFKADDTEETCATPELTACAINATAGGQKMGGGCRTACEKTTVMSGAISCSLGGCCCEGNAQAPCNDLTKPEVKEQACKISIFKEQAPPGFCPQGVCKKADDSQETCSPGVNFCSFNVLTAKPDGCTNFTGCGGGLPTTRALFCTSGACCCFADTVTPCNILEENSSSCNYSELSRICGQPRLPPFPEFRLEEEKSEQNGASRLGIVGRTLALLVGVFLKWALLNNFYDYFV